MPIWSIFHWGFQESSSDISRTYGTCSSTHVRGRVIGTENILSGSRWFRWFRMQLPWISFLLFRTEIGVNYLFSVDGDRKCRGGCCLSPAMKLLQNLIFWRLPQRMFEKGGGVRLHSERSEPTIFCPQTMPDTHRPTPQPSRWPAVIALPTFA